jgi:hypothetical protein
MNCVAKLQCLVILIGDTYTTISAQKGRAADKMCCMGLGNRRDSTRIAASLPALYLKKARMDNAHQYTVSVLHKLN